MSPRAWVRPKPPTDALLAGFRALVHLFDDDSLDVAAKMVKAKKVLQTAESMLEGDGADADEPPAQEHLLDIHKNRGRRLVEANRSSGKGRGLLESRRAAGQEQRRRHRSGFQRRQGGRGAAAISPRPGPARSLAVSPASIQPAREGDSSHVQ